MTRRPFDINAINAGRTRRDRPVPGGHDGYHAEPRNDYGRGGRGGSLYAELSRELDEIASRFEHITRRQPDFGSMRPAPRTQRQAAADHYGMDSIHGGIQSLKSEIRSQLRDELDQQYRKLRGDLEGLEQALAGTGLNDTFRSDLSELYRALEAVAEGHRDVRQGQNDIADTLNREFGALREQFHGLARDDSFSRLANRFDDMENRWSRMENRMDAGLPDTLIKDISGIAERLDQMQLALQSLPDHDALPALEHKIASLVHGLDSLSDRIGAGGSADFGRLEDRFDELSLAIAALQNGGDERIPEAVDRIEYRIAALAERLDAMGQGGQGAVETQLDLLNERLAALSDSGSQAALLERLDQLANQVEAAGRTRQIGARDFEALTEHFQAIARKIDTMAQDGNGADIGTLIPDLADHLDNRFLSLESRLNELRDASAGGMAVDDAVLDRLDDRLRALDDKMTMLRAADSRAGTGSDAGADEALLSHLDTRFQQLENQLDALRSNPEQRVADSGDHEALAERLELRIAELGARMADFAPSATDNSALQALDTRLEEIAHHLSHQAAGGSDDNSALMALEARIADLADRLGSADLSGDNTGFAADLNARLEAFEGHLQRQKGDLLEAAREAAEAAVQRLAQQPGSNSAENAQFAERLAQDIADLEALTRHSHERNADTFGAIHDTLLKIVDRISALETRPAAAAAAMPAAPAPAAPEFREISPAPSVQPQFDDMEDDVEPELAAPVPAEPETRQAMPKRKKAKGKVANLSPSQAAQAAAMAAMGDGEDSDELFADDDDFDMPESTVVEDDQPLPPGTAIPDLQAILKRVRDQKKQAQTSVESDVNDKDFFASVRRAAQAAANEAQTVGAKAKSAKVSSGKLQDIYGKFRRPILLAAGAAIIAIAVLQLGSVFLGSDESLNTQIIEEPVAPASNESAPLTPVPDENAVLPLTSSSDTAMVVEPKADDVLIAPPGTDTLAAPDQVASVNPEMAALSMEPAANAGASAALPTVPEGFGPIALADAASKGDPVALFEVGRRVAQGAEGASAALDWFKAAADNGYAPAQYRLGNMYEKGLGVTRDPAEAKIWYQMAAEQGNASAMHNLAVLYATGAAGTPDPDSAARWFVEAAELGVKDSQFNLGILHAKGQGVSQDLEESYKWFAIVAKTGDTDAAAKRDDVAKALPPEQLQAARAKADLWRPKTLDPKANIVDIPEDWRIAETTTASVDMKKAITNVQLILNKSGYDAGPADGLMGAKTRNAIKAFQKANAMPETGEVDEALVRALLAKNGEGA